MAQGIGTLQTTEMVGRGSIGKAIGGAGGDVERVEDAQAIQQIGDRAGEACLGAGGKIPEQAAKSMAPGLLPREQVQTLEGLFHRLMGREAGPFVMTVRSTQIGLEQVGAGLGQPVLGAIRHGGPVVGSECHNSAGAAGSSIGIWSACRACSWAERR